MSATTVVTGLLDRLWDHYCGRVEYARQYRDLVLARGGRVVNDHIAFRTFNAPTGELPPGITALSRMLEPLGYTSAGEYEFPDKYLNARHFEHADPLLPKVFVSQLDVARLPEDAAQAIRQVVGAAVDRLDSATLTTLQQAGSISAEEQAALIQRLFEYVTTRPWPAPPRQTVLEVNKASQYAAWTLLHGNDVNHFTAYINEQQVPEWPDLEATVEGLRSAGIPLKPEIEGDPGSKLRQTATQAVEEDAEVTEDDGKPARLRWSYAYYELAERGEVTGPDGRSRRFNGFLGPQATNLFEMTRRS